MTRRVAFLTLPFVASAIGAGVVIGSRDWSIAWVLLTGFGVLGLLGALATIFLMHRPEPRERHRASTARV